MSFPRNPLLRSALAAGALLALWLLLAPIQIGGRSAFIIVNGNSMEPGYHRGDLVIIRAAARYAVGEIVTYRHPEIGPVIHRIIGRDGERWVFRGDNNDFIDPYHPRDSELIGRAWLHIPGVGRWLLWLRRAPLLLALLLGGGVLLMIKVPSATRPRRTADAPAAGWRAWAISLLGALAIAALALAGAAFMRPASSEVSAPLTYSQRGSFSYTADAPAGLYDSAAAQPGDPVFRRLSHELRVAFSYQLVADAPAELGGSYGLTAELRAQNGWRRTLTLAEPRPLDADQLTVQGAIGLGQINDLIAQFEAQTGLQRQQYTLTLTPHIEVAGRLSGQPLHASFAPQLAFQIDDYQLQMVRGREGQDVLRPTQAGVIPQRGLARNSLSVLGLTLDVAAARRGAPMVAGAALGLIALIGLPLLRAARQSEEARIAMRYGPLIVGLAGRPDLRGARLLRVGRIDDLAKIAERHGALIARDGSADRPRYIVHADGAAYIYGEPPSAQGEPAPAAPAEAADAPGPPAPAGAEQPWQERFLAALRASGLAAEACHSVGVDMVTAYRERERSAEFAQAWKDARLEAWQQRTLKGVAR